MHNGLAGVPTVAVPSPSSGGRVTCPPVKHTRSVETVPVSPVPPKNPLNNVIPAPENVIVGSVVQSPENVTFPRLTVPSGAARVARSRRAAR